MRFKNIFCCRWWVLVLLFGVFGQEVLGQERNLGVVYEPFGNERMAYFPLYNGIKSQPIRVSLRSFCPTPGHQGSMGACVGYAFAYGALTIMQALENGWTDKDQITEQAFSPYFVFNQIKKDANDCTSGSSLEDAADLLKEKGVCLLKDFDSPNDCNVSPSERAFEKAKAYKIKEVGLILDRKTPPSRKIAALKRSLSNNMPVVANMQVYRSFVYLPPGSVFWEKQQTDEYMGMHSLVVVGYDDRNRTFELMSSWGTGWAKGGFAQISYDDMSELCMTAYQIVPFNYHPKPVQQPEIDAPPLEKIEDAPPSEEKPSPAISPSTYSPKPTFQQSLSWKKEAVFYLSGQFDFIELQEENGDYHFVKSEVVFEKSTGIYQTIRPTYAQNTLFQLQTKNIPIGKYVYVFTCDPKGKVELHWPKKQWSEMIPYNDALITIPSSESALQLSHLGKDFLCILYSEKKIVDVSSKIAQLKNYDDSNFFTQLKMIFKKRLIDSENIDYQKDKMWAESLSSESKGDIMAMVLRVVAR